MWGGMGCGGGVGGVWCEVVCGVGAAWVVEQYTWCRSVGGEAVWEMRGSMGLVASREVKHGGW